MKNHAEGKTTSLKEQMIKKLQLLDFEWNLNGWYASYCELVEFAATHGYCNVPRLGGTLGRWVSYQRELFKKCVDRKKNLITEDQIGMLDQVGFDWRYEDDAVEDAF